MKVFFSQDYTVDLGAHTFPTGKFGLVARRIAGELTEPPLSSVADLRLAHSPAWVEKVLSGTVTLEDESRMELRWSQGLAHAHSRQTAGTYLAAGEALRCGLGLHSGGGSHHAFRDYGEGFCVFNDLACALLRLRLEGRLRRAAVVDLDVHQGNGTASILAGEAGLFTFSMHQDGIYPEEKPPSTRDIGLAAGTTDDKYLKILGEELDVFLDETKPELVVYQAGVDCWEGDLLGGLALSRCGIAKRDERVFSACFSRGIPVVVTLGGGYAERIEDTVALHAATLSIGMESHRRLWNGGSGL